MSSDNLIPELTHDNGAQFIIPGEHGILVEPPRAPTRASAPVAAVRGAVIEDEDLVEANLRGRCLDDLQATDVDFTKANFERASLRRAVFRRCNFTAAFAQFADATDAVFEDCTFINSDWSHSVWRGVRATSIRLDGALICAVLGHGARISGSAVSADFGPPIVGSFWGQQLAGVRPGAGGTWTHARLDLDARRASFAGCILDHAVLTGDWAGASVAGASLVRTDLEHARDLDAWCAA